MWVRLGHSDRLRCFISGMTCVLCVCVCVGGGGMSVSVWVWGGCVWLMRK